MRDDEIFALEQNITSMRHALHEEIRQQHRLISDVGTLRKKFQEVEEHRAGETEAFRKKIDDLTRQCEVSNLSSILCVTVYSFIKSLFTFSILRK